MTMWISSYWTHLFQLHVFTFMTTEGLKMT